MKIYFKIAIPLVIAMVTALWANYQPDGVQLGGELPAYNSDVPATHTLYLGSDRRYHYFTLQAGAGDLRSYIPVDEATIKPAPFPVDSGQQVLVESHVSGVIKLMEPERSE